MGEKRCGLVEDGVCMGRSAVVATPCNLPSVKHLKDSTASPPPLNLEMVTVLKHDRGRFRLCAS